MHKCASERIPCNAHELRGRGMMENKHKAGLDLGVRLAADVVMVNLALAIVMTGRLFWLVWMELPEETPLQAMDRYLIIFTHYALIATAISVPVFSLTGTYTYARYYTLRAKILRLGQAVSLSYLLIALASILIRPNFVLPRTVLLLAWIVTFALMAATRLWSTLWKWFFVKELSAKPNMAVEEPRSVLVIGGAGYIGSTLLPKLLRNGYRVKLLDLFLFGQQPIINYLGHPGLTVLEGDFRHVGNVAEAMRGVKSVIHLGGIVGDPACSVSESLTIDVNLVANRMIAEIAKGSAVNHFIFASSCSVYGQSPDLLDEHSRLNPLSLYARTKVASEKLLLQMANGSSFSPVILRFGTIYGRSGRIRFDLVVNLLTAKAVLEGKITVINGNQWRPFLHVDDAAVAVLKCLEAPSELVGKQIFNVGSEQQNLRIGELGEIIQSLVPNSELLLEETNQDKRDYRVSFDKIRSCIGFEPQWTIEKGVEQIVTALKSGEVKDYHDCKYSNYSYLSQKEAISADEDRENWMFEVLGSGTSDHIGELGHVRIVPFRLLLQKH